MIDYPNLITERLFLRELTVQDAEAVYRYFSNPEVTQYMDIDVCKDIREAEEIITFHVQDSGCRYGVFSDAKLIGTCGFHCWREDSAGARAEMGFDLSPQYWGQGYMSEALGELLNIGFDLMKLDFIEATTEIENLKSQKLLAGLGFVKEPELKYDLFYFILRRNGGDKVE